MRQKANSTPASSETLVRNIRRATRKHHAAEEKIRIVLDGLRGETSIADLCRREGIAESMYYSWSKEFLEAGKRRLAGDTARAATTDEVKQLRREAQDLKEVVAERALELRLLKKRMARPLRKWFRHDNLISLHQRIRSRGPPRPRWRSARPGPNKRAGAKGAIFLTRIPGCRSTVRPSRFPPPANIKGRSAHKDARPTSSNYASAEPAILKVFPCRMTAQAMRASLLASATTAAFLCILANRPRSHAPNEVGLSRSVGKAARAPWINICCPAC